MKKLLTLSPFLLLGTLFLLRPETSSEAVRNGLTLCFRSVIPSLFPMMVVTSLLLRMGLASVLQILLTPFMGPLFRLRGACAMPLVMGLVGGYPVGASAAAELYRQGQCTKNEVERLLSFCNNCGPAFLLSYVGAGIFGSSLTGCRLYLIHVTAGLISGLIICRLVPAKAEPLPLPARGLHSPAPPLIAAFPQAVTTAFRSVLNICAFVTLFSAVTAMLPPETPPLITGFLELTTGLSRLQNTPAHRAAAAAIVGFGGLSVHCQTLSVLADAGLNARCHTAGKLLQALLSAIGACLFL